MIALAGARAAPASAPAPARAGRSNALTAGANRREHDRSARSPCSPGRSGRQRRSATSADSVCVSSSTPPAIQRVGDDAADHREDDDRRDAHRARPTRARAPSRSGGTSSDTCHSSAAFCMIVPENDTSSPIQISRKFRCWSATSDGGQRPVKRDAAWRCLPRDASRYRTSRSSTSNTSVAFAGNPAGARDCRNRGSAE